MTTTALEKAIQRSNGKVQSAYEIALRAKAIGVDLSPGSTFGGMGDWASQRGNRERYSQFRGWLYAAINAIASEGAGQPVMVGKLTGVEEKASPERLAGVVLHKNEIYRRKMPLRLRSKTVRNDFEIVVDHPLLDVLQHPNPMQGQWQLVYSFIANLCLTGWAYLIGGKTKNGLELYSLPTTWITPKHDKGPFSAFELQNPNNPTGKKATLKRENVAFAHLPNPADPLSAIAPAQSQSLAIRVDDHIQTSQERFFENGIFPSVVISIGRDPHPDVPGGIRPRLTGPQRRQVTAAIQKTMGGVQNYGEPAIVDGLIESVDRLSATQTEMGWEKSETTVRTRILSALGVHPYILGEAVSVGGYAQAAKIEERFCKRVNTYLDMLGNLITNWAAPLAGESEQLEVWWEECESRDPSIHWTNLREARKAGDISKNEMRAELGYPPDESLDDDEGMRSPLLDTVGGMTGTTSVLSAVAQGQIPRESAVEMLQIFLQISERQAEALVGEEGTYTPPAPPQAAPPAAEEEQPKEEEEEEEEEPEEGDEMEEATETLKRALAVLDLDPMEVAEQVVEAVKFNPTQPRDDHGRWTGGSNAPAGSGFREAKTTKEAEEVAQQWVKDGGTVSYRGMTVGVANEVNRELSAVYDEFPGLEKLHSIQSKAFTGRPPKDADAAYKDGAQGGELMLNTRQMGTEARWDEHVAEAAHARDVINNLTQEQMKMLKPATLRAVAEMRRYERTLVDGSLRGAVRHEMGHHFDWAVMMKPDQRDTRQQLIGQRELFQEGISSYSRTSAFEYVAESFVSYSTGVGKIDPNLRGYFDQHRSDK